LLTSNDDEQSNYAKSVFKVTQLCVQQPHYEVKMNTTIGSDLHKQILLYTLNGYKIQYLSPLKMY